MCIIAPAIGLMNVIVNLNHWQREEKHEYIGLALIMGLLWILKFFPLWVNIGYIFLMFVVIFMWPVKDN